METKEITNLTKEEFAVAMEALQKYWDEQKRQKAIEEWNTKLKIWLSACISKIGLAETKTLIRNANRDLRMIGEEDAY